VWKAKAKELGCNGSRCCDRSVVAPSGKWIAECPGCRRVVRRHRRRIASCGQCSGDSFNPQYQLHWKRVQFTAVRLKQGLPTVSDRPAMS
jgi:hypothetical protein